MPKIDITPLKNAGLKGVVGEIIKDEKSELELYDFLANVKAWEKMLLVRKDE